MKYSIIILAMLLCSCNWAKQKTKDGVNKTGEVVGKTGSEFVNGITKGVEQTFQNKIEFSPQLVAAGLKSGKITIHGTDSSSDNVLTAYLIFDGDINQKVMVKAYTEAGEECGRVRQEINGVKGEAKYADFVFDKRTNIDSKGKITFE